MSAPHIPVMLDEVVEALAPAPGGLYLDATFGAGGYARALLGVDETRVIACDRDPAARAFADPLTQAYPGRFVFAARAFSELEGALAGAGFEAGEEGADGIVFDLGVSSIQLDEAGRGFSFAKDGPLDMRMGQVGLSAADAVNHLSADQLAVIFRAYGEERRARRVALAILAARAEAPIETTGRLAEIIAAAVGPSKDAARIHPATRVFQALRLFINDELGELSRGLAAAERALKPAGRLVVVSFHSLEDRIVKTFLRARAGLEARGSRHAPEAAPGPEPSFALLFKGAKAPGEAEIASNPRSRSAKLRAGVRTGARAWAEAEAAARGVPTLADLQEAMG